MAHNLKLKERWIEGSRESSEDPVILFTNISAQTRYHLSVVSVSDLLLSTRRLRDVGTKTPQNCHGKVVYL